MCGADTIRNRERVRPCPHTRALSRGAVCTLPVEYCEWDPLFGKCKEWLDGGAWKELYPDLDEDGLAEMMTRLGFQATTPSRSERRGTWLVPAGRAALSQASRVRAGRN